ncbi:serine/threonine-protein phosphatase 7 long form [Dorcoceras hygrometricum]|uniref:Serine/threonine-protein phosphatase 7 long form n=1 Tax=Dorcoceras hygrometricum TaxID=472368 RepID=A0A2Z7AZY3_9LAMI|nr:serine/threonine-protein phosphatase 7 long form [Dorcoceras hygrometricum]
MSVEAGPVERSILYLQESHISNVIQPDNLDHTLRVRRSDNLIWDLWKSGVLHRCVRSCLNEMGFYGPALDGDKLHEVSRRGRPNFDWANHHRVFVDAWADRHNLVVETEYAVNFCMTDEYARWYDLITRRFVSPIDPVQVDSGYQPGDAYFRRVVRDGTSTIANICKGVAIEDLSREDLVEALTKSIATAAFLHELTLKTPQQQQHQARTSTRRRQGRGDNRRIGDDLQSFDTPDWRQSTSQTPLTSVSHQTSSGMCKDDFEFVNYS